jgi:hypothetical protein
MSIYIVKTEKEFGAVNFKIGSIQMGKMEKIKPKALPVVHTGIFD